MRKMTKENIIIDLSENNFEEAFNRIKDINGIINIIFTNIRKKVFCAIDPHESNSSLWRIDQADIKEFLISREYIKIGGIDKELLKESVKNIILNDASVLRLIFKNKSGKSILGIKIYEPDLGKSGKKDEKYYKNREFLRNILKKIFISNFPKAEVEYPKNWN